MTAVRGVRGATTVAANERGAILAGTRELLEHVIGLNRIQAADVASVWFTATPDLDAEFPAFAARQIGWTEVPLICATEIPVGGALERCVRVLVHWNTDLAQSEVRHVFLHGARVLRPQWALDLPGDEPMVPARVGETGAKGYERTETT